MQQTLRVVMAQQNCLVGDVRVNTQQVMTAIDVAIQTHQADMVVFPELALCGYPPEDLLLRPHLFSQIQWAIDEIVSYLDEDEKVAVVVGHPVNEGADCYNAASVLTGQGVIKRYYKNALPNYGVFDEKRYFKPGREAGVFAFKGFMVGLSICEDVWVEKPLQLAKQANAEVMINLNASPFHVDKMALRLQVVTQRAQTHGMPILYVNMVGGQDELVFDGASFVVDARGQVVQKMLACQAGISVVTLSKTTAQRGVAVIAGEVCPYPDRWRAIFNVLVLGLHDYVKKNHFKGVILGLSGGIDSALSLVIAVAALGAENVEAVLLPSRFTADMSIDDALQLAKNLQVNAVTLSIEPVYQACLETLATEFAGLPMDVTEENLQARCRGVLLMALSNKKGKMVLTTGNKSEMAVGYATLYGDMVGGFNVLKDVPKTWVFALATFCNRDQLIIPQRIIDRPPSAELRAEQKDTDSLPAYEVLDTILEKYIEQDISVSQIIEAGFEADTVNRVTQLVDQNEYKRGQSPPGVRITSRAFGKDRRYPMTSGYTERLDSSLP